MFKKEPQLKHAANIKSSDRRKLLKTILSIYGINQELNSKETELSLLPATTKQANFKSPQGFSGSIYFDEREIPIWFKSRDSQIYPTLFTLWKNGFLLPTVQTHSGVLKVLSNGADLMLPGTIPPFDSRCTKGCIVSVVDYEKPTVAQAVGICRLNLTQFDSVMGRSGVAVEILHNKVDKLFTLNDLIDIAEPDEVITTLPIKETEEEEVNHNESANVDVCILEESKQRSTSQEVKKNKDDVESHDSQDSIADIAEELSELSVEDLDNFFIKALLQAIKLESINLPVNSSQFMSNYVIKNFPAMNPEYCNMRRTSWKKTSKFLKAMDKKGYIRVKGKSEDLIIVEVMSQSDPLINNFIPHRALGPKVSASSTVPKPPSQPKNANDLSIINYYKPTSKSKPFFKALVMEFNAYYEKHELRKLLETYVKQKDLSDPSDRKNVFLDDVLNSTMSAKSTKSIARDKLFTSFLSTFSPYFKIVKPNSSADEVDFMKGNPQPVSIISETKIGRKVVTRVSNIEIFYIKPPIFADELKVKCSGSTTVGPCVQDPKVIEVTVQGPHGKSITELLRQKGVPTSLIKFEDKTKKKKRGGMN